MSHWELGKTLLNKMVKTNLFLRPVRSNSNSCHESVNNFFHFIIIGPINRDKHTCVPICFFLEWRGFSPGWNTLKTNSWQTRRTQTTKCKRYEFWEHLWAWHCALFCFCRCRYHFSQACTMVQATSGKVTEIWIWIICAPCGTVLCSHYSSPVNTASLSIR